MLVNSSRGVRGKAEFALVLKGEWHVSKANIIQAEEPARTKEGLLRCMWGHWGMHRTRIRTGEVKGTFFLDLGLNPSISSSLTS